MTPVSGKISVLKDLHFSGILKKTLPAMPVFFFLTLHASLVFAHNDTGFFLKIPARGIIITASTIILIILLSGIAYVLKRRLDDKMAKLEKAQQELLKQTEQLKMANEVTQTGLWESNYDEKTVFVSEQWYSMLGYSKKSMTMMISDLLEYVHPEDRELIIDFYENRAVKFDKNSFEKEIRLRHKDGSYCWVLSRSKVIEWNSEGKPARIIGLDMNIQTFKNARMEIEKSEKLFHAIFENAPYPVSISELSTGRFLAANRAFFDFHGITRDDLSELTVQTSSTIDKEQHLKIVEELESKGVIKNHETEIIKKDGSKSSIVFSCVLLDPEGNKKVLGITVDVTEMKNAEKEREKLQERLHHSQKLEAVGILAGGVAHDFNNMLGAIIGYTELTMMEMDHEDPRRKNLDEIMSSARRSAGLVRQLLAFARKQKVEPVLFDINKSIGDLLKMLRRLIGENIELVWEPGDESLRVSMDPSHFDQIMVNLCVNARDAISDVGSITIESSRVFIDENFASPQYDIPPGEYVRLTVSDTGCGMDRDTIQHIFDPFYTTKEMGQGTGMGLATVYGIIKQNKGLINVYSKEDKGTVFIIYLPLSSEELSEEQVIPAEKVPRSQGETVLLLEDEPALLELAKIMLTRLGYNVISATTPADAVNIVEDKNLDIHLLITDVIMPEMNGRELADRVQAIRPDVKVIFMSGYTDDVIGSQGVLENGVPFIQKPFSMKNIGIIIREVLAQCPSC